MDPSTFKFCAGNVEVPDQKQSGWKHGLVSLEWVVVHRRGPFFFTCHELLSRSDLVWLDLTRPGQRQRVVFLELIGGQQKKFEKESIITSQLYPLPPNHFPSSGDPGQRHAINSPSKGVFSESRERSLGSL